MVDFNELADKAKGLVGDHADQIKSGIDKTGDFVGGKIGRDKVDPIQEKVKGLVDKLAGDQAAPSAEPTTPPAPPAAQEPPAPAPEPPVTPPAS
jgi:hypothetical protein